jgi:spore coat polysaccharide biosynthesis protein SpsF (cytidylyltransferase family)
MIKYVFITVRSASSRLPDKCLMDVSPGKKAIEFLIERLLGHGYKLVLCTSVSPGDGRLEHIARNYGIDIFRGSEKDKLRRWIDCATNYGAEFFVTADGDDLFVGTDLIDLAFKQYKDKYHKFIKCSAAPTGSFSWGMQTYGLAQIQIMHAQETDSTEMCFAWFDDIHELENIPDEYKRKDLRITLDYTEDLEFFRAVIGSIGNKPLKDIFNFLDDRSDIVSINISREEDYRKNQISQMENPR